MPSIEREDFLTLVQIGHSLFYVMRVRIIFRLENKGGFIPFHHQSMISEAIDKLLCVGGSQEFLNYRQYNFSALKGQMKIGINGLNFFSSKVTLVFSSMNKPFVEYFVKTLLMQKKIVIGLLELIPDSVRYENPIIQENAMKFLCISPMVLHQYAIDEDAQNQVFICPNSDKFSDLLYESTMDRMITSGAYEKCDMDDCHKFQLIPDNTYLKRLQKLRKRYSRIYLLHHDRGEYQIRGYTFPFVMHAPKKVLVFLYQNGLGYFGHKGFGMIDIVQENEAVVNEAVNQRNQKTSHVQRSLT